MAAAAPQAGETGGRVNLHATAVVAGIMLAVGTITNESLNTAVTTERLNDNWWWYLLYVALAVGGIVVQLRSTDPTSGSLRESWTAGGGRQLRRQRAV